MRLLIYHEVITLAIVVIDHPKNTRNTEIRKTVKASIEIL